MNTAYFLINTVFDLYYKDILGVLKRLEAENRTESGENA